MIHEEKWYTCDRCGERIENLVEAMYCNDRGTYE